MIQSIQKVKNMEIVNTKEKILQQLSGILRYSVDYNEKLVTENNKLVGYPTQEFWELWKSEIKHNAYYRSFIFVSKNIKTSTWYVLVRITLEQFELYFKHKQKNGNRKIIQCPECGCDEEVNAIYCSTCGYNLQAKQQLLNEFGEEDIEFTSKMEPVIEKSSQKQIKNRKTNHILYNIFVIICWILFIILLCIYV